MQCDFINEANSGNQTDVMIRVIVFSEVDSDVTDFIVSAS